MNNLDPQYQALLQYIINHGTKKQDRTGTGTISVFGRQIRHKMSEGFPLITSKKMAFKTMVTELLWFLKGDTNIKFLVDNNCHIWDGDCYANYLKEHSKNPNGTAGLKNGIPFNKSEFIALIQTSNAFAKKWGELGPIYGAQWRNWRNGGGIETSLPHPDGSGGNLYEAANMYIDQIANLIRDLKTNPDSRRLMVNAWNVGELDQMVLQPCHYGFQVYTRELSDVEQRARCHPSTPNAWDDLKEFAKLTGNSIEDAAKTANIPTRAISLMWNQRSCDVPLGIPANIMSYAILLMMLAKQVNMVPDELIGNLGDCHIYLNQVEGVEEQLTREPYPLPTLRLSDRVVNDISEYTYQDIILENYQSHPKIYFPLSN